MDRPTLVKYDYYKGPKPLDNMWSLTQGALTMLCTLKTHSLGWELRLIAGKNMVRSQVCKNQTDVYDTAEAWHKEALAKGWA